jgi:hypothetical protein
MLTLSWILLIDCQNAHIHWQRLLAKTSGIWWCDFAGNTKRGSITVPLTSGLTGKESAVLQMAFFVFYLQNRLIQTTQTGGQQYGDTSPFSIPWIMLPLPLLSMYLQHKFKWSYLCRSTQGCKFGVFVVWDNWQFCQRILKGKVSLYHWPPVWLVWISLFCK